MTVSKGVKTNRWPDRDTTLIVDIGGKVIFSQENVKVDLMRGDEGDGKFLLNPKIYLKLAN